MFLPIIVLLPIFFHPLLSILNIFSSLEACPQIINIRAIINPNTRGKLKKDLGANVPTRYVPNIVTKPLTNSIIADAFDLSLASDSPLDETFAYRIASPN